MNKIAFITGGTPNLAGPAGVFFLSLRFASKEQCDSADCFFLTNGEIKKEDQKALDEIDVRVEQIGTSGFTPKHQSKFVDYFTLGILSKFHIFKKMAHYDRVIWFDSDQLNTRDISSILDNTKDNDFFIVGRGEECSDGWSNFIKDPSVLKKYLENSPFDFSLPSITGNFFGVNKKFNSSQGSTIFRDAINIYQLLQSDIYGGEQGIIYIIMQKYFKNIVRLDNHLFTPHPKSWPIKRLMKSKLETSPYFIHAYGQPKFWTGEEHPLFDFYYDIWIKLGGSDFRKSSLIARLYRFALASKREISAMKGRLF